MKLPLSFSRKGEHLVCKLNKSLYGQKKPLTTGLPSFQMSYMLLVTFNPKQIIQFLQRPKEQTKLLSYFMSMTLLSRAMITLLSNG